MATFQYLKTKHGNRIFFAQKPKEMSRTRFGIVSNYFDFYARTAEQPINVCGIVSSIKDLYYSFYDRLFQYYGKPNGFGYIKSKEVVVNVVGDLRSRRYFISDRGKRRLEELKKEKANRIKKQKQDERKRLKSCSCAD